ncbi:GtrA family protein [Pseudoflavitalea sp. G-6-1-2]|uniref:GtrA family protein n=1 Tax=Pseudoflavitalea sp. G-6-1-2 TaxID=2728841 RepID=UPI001F10A628|nr:GtrA family protein [Pseudoflavitalea sp. G-6-1-2]
MLKDWIIQTIDFFYPPFKKWMPKQTFRYAACGGGNTLLDIFIYYISYNFILNKQIVHTPVGAISPHVMAIFMAFIVSFPMGYFLNRFVVFPGSTLKGRVQLFRYFLLVVICIGLNYIFIKLFVEQCHIYPTVAKILTTVIVVSFSYLTQKQFTFKVEPAEVNNEQQ